MPQPDKRFKNLAFSRRLKFVLPGFGVLFPIFIALGLPSCSPDIVTTRYPTLAEARADRLFERGWLPDVLPTSTRRIRTSNNLDLGTSVGEFDFIPAQAPMLFRALMPGTRADAPFEDWTETVQGYSDREFSAWTYKDSDTTWVFFCHGGKGHCDYFSWLG